jgi:hypothetical protein
VSKSQWDSCKSKTSCILSSREPLIKPSLRSYIVNSFRLIFRNIIV